MDLGLKGRTALVCAASSGLGFGCAKVLAEEGARVAICGRDRARLDAAAKRLGVGAAGLTADLDRAEDRERLVRDAAAALGRIDILVTNNGGPKPGGLDAVDDADYRQAIERNLLSAIHLTRLVLPGMRERKWGRVAHVASISVKQPIAGLILSNTARVGLAGFTKTAAGEVAKDGVRMHVVCPGSFDTERIRDLARDRAKRKGTTAEDEMRAIEGEIPVGRLGRPEELGALVAFLCSDRADYATGAVLALDGGASRGLL